MSRAQSSFGSVGRPKPKRIFSIALLLALVIAVTLVSPAQAHERVEVGPYVLVLGWVKEPVIVGERNAIFLEVTEDGEAVKGLEGTLDVEVHYAGRLFLGNLSPTADPGVYNVEIFPTVRGQYEVHLSGTIGDETVDLVVEPEEVLQPDVLQFPEQVPDARDLESEIEALRDELSTANTQAMVGLGVGVLGVLLAASALLRGRR